MADQKTREEWATITEDRRRNARFTYAERRVKQIVDGAPALTSEQRAELAAILSPPDRP